MKYKNALLSIAAVGISLGLAQGAAFAEESHQHGNSAPDDAVYIEPGYQVGKITPKNELVALSYDTSAKTTIDISDWDSIGPNGKIGVYFIVANNAMSKKRARSFTSQTSTWLANNGVSQDRASLTFGGYYRAEAGAKIACDFFTTQKTLLTPVKSEITRNAETRNFDYFIPVYVGKDTKQCPFSGLGVVGGGGMIVLTDSGDGYSYPARLQLETFKHELGHNLGLDHARVAYAKKTQSGRAKGLGELQTPSLSSLNDFYISEYASKFSIMGQGSGLSLADLYGLGVPPQSMRTVSAATNSVRIAPPDSRGATLISVAQDETPHILAQLIPGCGVQISTVPTAGAGHERAIWGLQTEDKSLRECLKPGESGNITDSLKITVLSASKSKAYISLN